MPGGVIRALPKTKYNFASLIASSGVEVVVAKGLDVSAYREATLLCRMHEKDIGGGAGNWKVEMIVRADAPTTEDPGAEWTPTPAADLATVTIDSSSSAYNSFQLDSVNTPFGGWLKLIIKPTQSSGSAETTFQIVLSADLIVKS